MSLDSGALCTLTGTQAVGLMQIAAPELNWLRASHWLQCSEFTEPSSSPAYLCSDMTSWFCWGDHSCQCSGGTVVGPRPHTCKGAFCHILVVTSSAHGPNHNDFPITSVIPPCPCPSPPLNWAPQSGQSRRIDPSQLPVPIHPSDQQMGPDIDFTISVFHPGAINGGEAIK